MKKPWVKTLQVDSTINVKSVRGLKFHVETTIDDKLCVSFVCKNHID